MEPEEAALARLLPVRPPPKPGELLASWIARTAAAYQLPPGRFLRERWERFPVRSVRGRRPSWRYPHFPNNLENNPTPKVMAQATGIQENEIKALRLVNAERSLIRYDLVVPFGVWCRRGQYHLREFVRLPESYCPECLAQDFYLRRVWRIGLLNVCLDHRRELREFCPACGDDLDFFGQLLGKRRQPAAGHELACPSCGFNLVQAPRHSPGQPVSARFFVFHQFMSDLLHGLFRRVPPDRGKQMVVAVIYLMKRFRYTGVLARLSACHDPASSVRERAGGSSAAFMRRPVPVRLATFRLVYRLVESMGPRRTAVQPEVSRCWDILEPLQRGLLHEMATILFPRYIAAGTLD